MRNATASPHRGRIVPRCRYALLILLCSVSCSLKADEPPCSCPDVYDLAGRRWQIEAAIKEYQAQLAAWSAANSIPAAEEGNRATLQSQVGSAMANFADARANRGAAATDPGTCVSTIKRATTACMTEALLQHEAVHAAACRVWRVDHAFAGQYADLAEYAREEIASYQAELDFINAQLGVLEELCRFSLTFHSKINGTLEDTTSDATADVDLVFEFSKTAPPKPLSGKSKLTYVTKEGPPPKLVGPPMLVKLASACYAASHGKGDVSFEVSDGWLMREQTPPFNPLLELTVAVGTTQEVRETKGPRPCKHTSTAASFWTYNFLMYKPHVSGPNDVLVDKWTFAPRSGVFAEKDIQGTCQAPGSGPISVPGLAITIPGLCSEKTTLTLWQKHR